MKADAAVPDLVSVATLIAGGPPPEGLITALEYWRIPSGEGINREYFRGRFKRMLDAIEVLEKDLPIVLAWPFGIRNKSAEIIYGSLGGVRRDLESAIRGMEGPGRKANIGEQICVFVVAECWKLLHGTVQPHSLRFQETVDAYWQACGHNSKGDPENWRRVIDRALAVDHQWIRSHLALMVHNPE